MTTSGAEHLPPRNAIQCIHFSRSGLAALVGEGCGNPDAGSLKQVTYLGGYLSNLEAETVLVEDRYVDRQFVEEYATYYSRCFQPIAHHCKRLHFFNAGLNRGALRDLLEEAGRERLSEVEAKLQRHYLGFIVVRPLPSAPIGRTVLKSYVETGRRKYPHTVHYPVHVCGLTFEVEGIAFQQQDTAVAACATTALWTALQRVCRNEGVRAPTTSEITSEAVRHWSPDGRAFPSAGLRTEQMMDALRAFQFPPEIIHVADSPRQFMLQMHAYLRSGIPMVLFLDTEEDAHAVTAVGFEMDYRLAEPHEVKSTLQSDRSTVVALRNLQYRQVFVHDDRMGPYARAVLDPQCGVGAFELAAPAGQEASDDMNAEGSDPEQAPKGAQGEDLSHLPLMLEWPDGTKEQVAVRLGIVPLYPKLRTCAEELVHSALRFAPFLDTMLADTGYDLGLEIFFDRAGTYQAGLFDSCDDFAGLAELQTVLSLSRYVGISRWYAGQTVVADVVWDTTDRIRKTGFSRSVLAIVNHDERFKEAVRSIADGFGVPRI